MKFIFLLCLLGCYGISEAHHPRVYTPSGIVQGYYKKSYYNRTYSAFEGIPYAQPPIGDLRFEEPISAKNWDGILFANTSYECLCFLPIPALFGDGGTEDCLYMYVYVPRKQIDPNENLDVVIHIHGGIFMYGKPSMIAGPDYMMDKDVVFVTFNFRSGLLGFLSTEDDVVPGNNGLKDQVLAMTWIKNNIKYFGGNPNSITLTGLSSGAISVHFHYLSPLSKGLFNRGLSQSGTVLSPWAIAEDSLSKAQVIANYFNCSVSSTQLMVNCLKQIDGQELMDAIQDLYVYQNAVPFAIFGPVVEQGNNPFLSEHPYRILEKGEVYDVPWVSSNTKHEGIYPVGFFVFLGLVEEINEKWDELMPYLMDYYLTTNKSDWLLLSHKIKEHYLNNKDFSMENIYDVVEIFSHRLFLVGSEKSIRLHVKAVKSPIYYYFFEYILQLSFIFANGRDMHRGSAHTDDSRLMIKLAGSPDVLEENDEKMMNCFTEFLANYAKTGVPVFHNVQWKPLDKHSEEIDYLNIISPDHVEMKKTKHIVKDNFWKTLPIYEDEKLL